MSFRDDVLKLLREFAWEYTRIEMEQKEPGTKVDPLRKQIEVDEKYADKITQIHEEELEKVVIKTIQRENSELRKITKKVFQDE